MVAFWTTCACGLIFTTSPANCRSGNASTVIVAGIPVWIFPTSVSLTSAESWTVSRFAIFMMTVPPPSVGLEITVPSTASISRMVPVIGARTWVSSIASLAVWRFAVAVTTAACAVA